MRISSCSVRSSNWTKEATHAKMKKMINKALAQLLKELSPAPLLMTRTSFIDDKNTGEQEQARRRRAGFGEEEDEQED